MLKLIVGRAGGVSESKKKSKKTAVPNTSTVVVSKPTGLWSKFHLPTLTRRRLLVVLGVILLIAAASTVFILLFAPEKAKVLPEGTETDYSMTNKASLTLLLKYDYDITVDELSQANLPKQLDSFTKAHNVGLALSRLGKPELALQAYQIADNKNNDAGFDFYVEMYSLAYEQGNNQLGDKAYDQAVKSVNESDAADDEKQSQLLSLSSGKKLLRKDQ